jgi:hypothetical protein
MPNHQRIVLGQGKVFSARHFRIVTRCLLKLPNPEQLSNLMLLGTNGCDDLEELEDAKDQR